MSKRRRLTWIILTGLPLLAFLVSISPELYHLIRRDAAVDIPALLFAMKAIAAVCVLEWLISLLIFRSVLFGKDVPAVPPAGRR